MLSNFADFLLSVLIFFKIHFFEKFFQEYHQSVKQLGTRPGPTFCRAWSESKQFAKIIGVQHQQVRS